MIPKLVDIAKQCRTIIESAESMGVTIDDGNVVDLCADNLPDKVSLQDIRCALVVAGFAVRYPKATRCGAKEGNKHGL